MRMRNPKDKDELLNGCDYYYEDNFNNDNNPGLLTNSGEGPGFEWRQSARTMLGDSHTTAKKVG